MEEIRKEAYKIRMLEELEELIIKIDRLSRYISNERAKEEATDIELEEIQLNHMLSYKEILKQRILKITR